MNSSTAAPQPAASLPSTEVLRHEGIVIDLGRHVVTVRGRGRVELTPKEFALLCLLVRTTNTVVSRSRIIIELWGLENRQPVDLRTVDQHVARLRRKIGDNRIATVNTFGYRLTTRDER